MRTPMVPAIVGNAGQPINLVQWTAALQLTFYT
jgi:hypothetical protein